MMVEGPGESCQRFGRCAGLVAELCRGGGGRGQPKYLAAAFQPRACERPECGRFSSPRGCDCQLQPGTVRVVITRSLAQVPGCPDWSDKFASNLENATSDGFGCAVNSNFAAMVADPEHLLRGAEGTGETVVMSSTKAIQSYRDQEPSGNTDLSSVSTQGGN